MSRSRPIRVVQYGLGPIGLECARTLLAKSAGGRVSLAGAVDIDPDKAGRDVARLAGAPRDSGVIVSADAAATLRACRPDVVLHTTVSGLDAAFEQLEFCARAGAHVVSSSEELFFPYERHPAISDKLDRLGRECGVALVGTGVNPGFVMDTLALAATGVCREVRGLRAERVVDAGRRRLPLQRKVGAGITPEAFAERKRAGTIGHVGLRESLLFVAHGLGWRLDRVGEELEPVIAERPVPTPQGTVQPGQVAGVHHTATGFVGERDALALDLRMFVGAEDPHDAVRVDGDPPVDLWIRGGVFGDTATVAALVNAIPLVLEAAPGLRTTADLPVPRAFATGTHRD